VVTGKSERGNPGEGDSTPPVTPPERDFFWKLSVTQNKPAKKIMVVG